MRPATVGPPTRRENPAGYPGLDLCLGLMLGIGALVGVGLVETLVARWSADGGLVALIGVPIALSCTGLVLTFRMTRPAFGVGLFLSSPVGALVLLGCILWLQSIVGD